MKLKQFTSLSNSVKFFSTTHKISQALAIGGLAIGAATAMSAAPAQAVVLNTGELSFSDGTGNFSSQVSPTPGNSFSVNFNPASLAFVTNATGSFSPFFPVIPNQETIAPSTGTFNFVGVNLPNTFDYSLAAPLTFAFTKGVNLTVGSGSIFRGLTNNANGTDFSLLTKVGSVFSNAGDIAPINTLDFSFGDTSLSGSGTYRISASSLGAQVPEPFTIIGTIVGGTAAFRMRKKLIASVNK
jgi:hypothetical protein